MARQKKVKAELSDVGKEPSDEIPSLTEIALGIYKQDDGSYYLAEVVYDPVTGEAALQDLHSLGISKLEASERFKIEAVKKGFV
jgi:hypothetical protein